MGISRAPLISSSSLTKLIKDAIRSRFVSKISSRTRTFYDGFNQPELDSSIFWVDTETTLDGCLTGTTGINEKSFATNTPDKL